MAHDLGDSSPRCRVRSRHPHAVFWLFTPFTLSTLQRRHPRLSSTTSHTQVASPGRPSFPRHQRGLVAARSEGPRVGVTGGGACPLSALSVALRVPRSTMAHWPSGLPFLTASRLSRRCVSVVRVFSSTRLPGFAGPESSVLPVDLPPSVPFPFRVRRYRVRFLRRLRRRAGGLPGVRHTTSPYAVPLQCTAATTTGYRGSLCHVCSPPSAHPYSGFAVRYVHGFCLMLPSDTPSLEVPLPCWRFPSVRPRRASSLSPPFVG